MAHSNFTRVAHALALTTLFAAASFAQLVFTPGNLVVVVEGCGVHGGTCTSVPNGSGTGAGNSSTGGYGDNQASAMKLFQYTPTGTASVSYVNSLALPQTASGANFPVSAEYGSSSEGQIQLSGTGQYLTLMGYGINSDIFNAAYLSGFTTDLYGAAPSGALAQSGSLTTQSNYTPVARVIALVDANGNVNSATALYNVFNTNNPRSIYTADGNTSAYVSGQGSGCDATGGVFYTALGLPNLAPTAITGIDTAASSSCLTTGSQDTRDVQIFNNTLYISVDSTEGKSNNRSMIGSLGNPPATSLFTPPTQTSGYTTGPSIVTGLTNSGATGKITITTGANTNGNNLNSSSSTNKINMSPMNYFFASASVLYVADTGNPKNDSNGDTNSAGTTSIGDGGLQKWINSKNDGSGTWSLAYTLYKGLTQGSASSGQPWNGGVVNNGSASGTSGLYGVAGVVNSGAVNLYVTNSTLNDLDPTYLFGVTDTLSFTTPSQASSEAFTMLEAAPADSNFKGLSFAPSIPAGGVEITSVPSGLTFTSAGTGCAPGTYTTPITLAWTPSSVCTLTTASTQNGTTGVQYTFANWEDSSTGTTRLVTAPSATAVYSASFSTQFQLTTAAGTGGTVSAGGYFASGSNATVTATPNAGYYFTGFSGSTTSTTSPVTLAITGPQAVTANFALQTTPTIVWGAQTITWGTPLSAQQLNASANVPGTFTYSQAAGTILPAGTQTLSVTFTPSSQQYTSAMATITITVNAAPPAITPGTVTLQYAQGTTPALPIQTLTVTVDGVFAPFTATSSQPWLVTPGPGDSTRYGVTLNPTGLTPGIYTASLNFTSSTGSTQIPVTLTVTGPPSLVVPPGSVSLSGLIGSSATSAASLPLTSSSSAIPFTVSSSIPWLTVTASAVSTPATLQIQANPAGLLAGTYQGAITVTSSMAANSPFTIPVTYVISTGFAGIPSTMGITNSGSLRSGPMAPNTIVALFDSLGCGANTQVTVNGTVAQVLFANGTQINFVTPGNLIASANATVVVTCNGQSATITAPTGANAPGVFTADSSGAGQGSIVNSDGTVNTAANPAARGSFIAVYGTGFGPYAPTGADGLTRLQSTVTATIGGTSANVLYAGAAPTETSGLQQINIAVPAGIGVGSSVPIVLTVNGFSTAANVTVAIK